MKNEEVNKIIAEYMDYAVRRDGKIHRDDQSSEIIFTESLDVLVLVWERLRLDGAEICLFNYAKMPWCCEIEKGDSYRDKDAFSVEYEARVIQEAAAHATAKAILALEEK